VHNYGAAAVKRGPGADDRSNCGAFRIASQQNTTYKHHYKGHTPQNEPGITLIEIGNDPGPMKSLLFYHRYTSFAGQIYTFSELNYKRIEWLETESTLRLDKKT
jgi:hypothetical protein